MGLKPIAVLALAWFLYDTVLPAWNRPSSDFPNYYTAALLVRQHQPLHLFYDWPWFQRRIELAGIDRQLGGYVPQTPLAMLPFVPLSYVSPLTARRLWVALNLFFLGVSLLALSRLTRFPLHGLWLLAFLGYPAFRSNFILGQYYVFLLAILTGAVWMVLRKRDAAGGILLGVSLVLKLYGGPLLLLILLRRRWRAAVGFVAASALLVFLAAALFGWRDLADFGAGILPRALAGETLDPFHKSNGTAVTMLRRIFVREPELNQQALYENPAAFAFVQRLFTFAVVFGLVAAETRPRRVPLKTAIAWWLIGILLISPNTASYTFVLALLPVALLLDEAAIGLPLIAAWVLLCLPLWPAWNWWFPKFWVLLFLFVVVGRRELNAWAAVAALILAAITTSHAASDTRQRVVTEPGAIYSSWPVVTKRGLLYESIGADRYLIRRGSQSIAMDGDAFHPAAPDAGDAIYFEALSAGVSRIMRFDQRTRTRDPLPIEIANPSEPAISHDGATLAFVAAGDLYNFDHRKTRKVGGVHDAREPSFAPGDASIVFADTEGIASIGIPDSPLTRLVRNVQAERPQLLPGNTTLLFAARQHGNWQIRLQDLRTGRYAQLTRGNCGNFAPVFDSGSDSILYASDCGRGVGLPALIREPLPDQIADFVLHPPDAKPRLPFPSRIH